MLDMALSMRARLTQYAPEGQAPRERFWNAEHCPHCSKVATSVGSVSGFYWNERNVIIYYWLCRLCGREIAKASRRHRRLMEDRTERNLIAGVSNALDGEAASA